MFVFDTDSRVQNTDKGIRFYEQDALCSEYSFSGNLTVEVKLDYLSPGFGLLMIEERNGTDLANAYQSYLFKLGTDDFRFLRKKFDSQEELKKESCLFSASTSNENTTLSFIIKNASVEVRQKYDNDKYLTLGTCELPKIFNDYKIGFYSNAGNVIREIKFYENVPPNWRTSIHNVLGGRLSFSRDTITFENCEKYAEAEQPGIKLNTGTYYLKYVNEPVNGLFDVKAFVEYPQEEDKDEELEDDEKNLLDEDGSFTIPSDDTTVNLKFRGHNGRIKNICIVDKKEDTFIETDDSARHSNGSYIIVDLNNLTGVTWDAIILSVPEWIDYTKECPYAVIKTATKNYSLRALGLLKDTRYLFELNAATYHLKISEYDTKQIVYDSVINITQEDHKNIRIMSNLTSIIYELKMISGKTEIDTVTQKTAKKFVTSDITSPIIVTNESGTEVYDISSSYRKVVGKDKKFLLFKEGHTPSIPNNIPVNLSTIVLYGIPSSATIDESADKIEKYASSYTIIPESDYVYKNRSFYLKNNGTYAYTVIEYAPAGEYTYEFINYEREVFDTSSNLFELEKPLAERLGSIIVYGIKKDSHIYDECLYTVPDASNISSIDYYADSYEIISDANLIVDYESNKIRLDGVDISEYQEFVIDYLKKNSVAINYREDYGEYELDISSEEEKTLIHYDMHNDGGAYEYLHTDVLPDKDKYICLHRKKVSS